MTVGVCSACGDPVDFSPLLLEARCGCGVVIPRRFFVTAGVAR